MSLCVRPTLGAFISSVVRFITAQFGPFANLKAERDIRMPKPKHKVSGGFRFERATQTFATPRCGPATLREQSSDTYRALVFTFQGNPPMPRFA